MDDDVELFFGSEVELLAEELGLAGFVKGVVFGGAGVFAIAAGEAGVIEAAFADGHDFGMVGEGAEFVGQFGRRFGDVGGVPANGGEDVGKTFGDLHGFEAAFEGCADGDDAGDPRGLGACDELVGFAGEVRKIEVRVCVEKFWCHTINMASP